MGLFNKNPNETAYAGGTKHFTDVIKNTGPSEALIWRQPEEDFNENSTLIVMPGEKAIFIKGGTIEQVFDNGTYKLSTENYPFISRLRNVFTGGIHSSPTKSCPMAKRLETDVTALVNDLEKALNKKNIDEAGKLVDIIKQIMDERNRIVAFK